MYTLYMCFQDSNSPQILFALIWEAGKLSLVKIMAMIKLRIDSHRVYKMRAKDSGVHISATTKLILNLIIHYTKDHLIIYFEFSTWPLNT